MTTREAIAALIKAGWNLPGIAFVLGVDIWTVKVVYWEMKARMK